jgi:hypothetical protein
MTNPDDDATSRLLASIETEFGHDDRPASVASMAKAYATLAVLQDAVISLAGIVRKAPGISGTDDEWKEINDALSKSVRMIAAGLGDLSRSEG